METKPKKRKCRKNHPQSKEHASGAEAVAAAATCAVNGVVTAAATCTAFDASDAAAAAAAVATGRRTIVFRIDACRSTFCCLGSGTMAAAGSEAAGSGRLEPERTIVKRFCRKIAETMPWR